VRRASDAYSSPPFARFHHLDRDTHRWETDVFEHHQSRFQAFDRIVLPTFGNARLGTLEVFDPLPDVPLKRLEIQS
jgi:hypothetical protein